MRLQSVKKVANRQNAIFWRLAICVQLSDCERISDTAKKHFKCLLRKAF